MDTDLDLEFPTQDSPPEEHLVARPRSYPVKWTLQIRVQVGAGMCQLGPLQTYSNKGDNKVYVSM